MKRRERKIDEHALLSRPDLRRIAELIEPGSRVLDLGCGDGAFLRYLAAAKQVTPLGIEIDPARVDQCVHNGIPVIHGDLKELTHPEHLLREVTRIGRRGLVGFINFGHIRNRMQLLFRGRMPHGRNLPYAWYNTPNIHLGTIRDFRMLCAELDLEILRAMPTGAARGLFARTLPNFLTQAAIFEIRRHGSSGEGETPLPARQNRE